MIEDDPGTPEAQAPPPERSVGHRILDGAGSAWASFRAFLGIWFLPALATAALIVMIVLVWWKVGIRPVGFGIVIAIGAGFVIWNAIRVYYQHVIQVNLEDGHSLSLTFWDVPIEIAHFIHVKGARGYVRDAWGREMIMVSEFDPLTLEGIGTWPDNLTPLHFAARWKTAKRVVDTYERLVTRYGVESIKARLDALAGWVEVAEYAGRTLDIGDTNLDDMVKTALRHGGDDGPGRPQ